MSPLNNNQIQVINNSSTIATAKSLRLYDLNSLPNELILKIFDELKYTHGALVRSCKRFWELATKRHSLLAFAYFIFNNKPLSKKVSYASPLTKEDVPFFKELIEECQVNFNELLINPSLNSAKVEPLALALMRTKNWIPFSVKERAQEGQIKQVAEHLCHLKEVLTCLTQENQAHFTQFLQTDRELINESYILSNIKIDHILNQLKCLKPIQEELLLFIVKYATNFHNFRIGDFIKTYFDCNDRARMLKLVE